MKGVFILGLLVGWSLMDLVRLLFLHGQLNLSTPIANIIGLITLVILNRPTERRDEYGKSNINN